MIEPSNNRIQNCVRMSFWADGWNFETNEPERNDSRRQWQSQSSKQLQLVPCFASDGVRNTAKWNRSLLFAQWSIFSFVYLSCPLFFFHSSPLSQNVWYATPILADLYGTGNDVESCQIMEMLKSCRKKKYGNMAAWGGEGERGGGSLVRVEWPGKYRFTFW